MNNQILSTLLKKLIQLKANKTPFLSCFVNLDQPRHEALAELEGRARLLRHALPSKYRQDFDDALSEIQNYLATSLNPQSHGVAIYSRWGDEPVFLPMQFEAPLKTHLSADTRPEIYPLIELKDVYHRFVTVITTENEARILETTLGGITEEILTERPELRERLGREWTREHYQNHKREREDQFIREKIKILDDLMSQRGHNHLIIAGSPKMVGKFTRALPKRLREKVISTVASNPGDDISPILREAVHLFIAAENIESHHRVGALEAALYRTGLAAIGFQDCRQALTAGYADLLLVDQHHTETRQREELVRLAAQLEIPVETVNRNPVLERMGGFGCLLRFLPPGRQAPRKTLAA